MTGLIRLLGVKMRVSGLARLPDRPVLFIANHFTRSETFLLPYAIHHRFRTPVHSLATHTLFRGVFAKYLHACGVMSVRDPNRNRTIIGELMTDRASWVIYPEGGLVKSKQTVHKGRLMVRRADRHAPPHTGAALMALKAEVRKDRYQAAWAAGDRERCAHYEERFGITGPDDLSTRGVVIVPVTVTYHQLRAGNNLAYRAARLLNRRLDPRLAEELQVEGTVLFGDSETSVHFGEPIDVRAYLGRTGALARRVITRFRSPANSDVFLRRPARRLTGASMRSVYERTEINLEHLFCAGLRLSRRDVVPVRQFHKALYVAAMELRQNHELRLHPILGNGIVALTTGEPFAPIEAIERLARNEGVLRRDGDDYVIDHAVLDEQHDFHDVRLRKMVQVIANELEPIELAMEAVRRAVNLAPPDLDQRLPRVVAESDRRVFRREYEAWHEPGVSKPAHYGEPFFLEARGARTGIVLVHGYLAAPEQMRPLAEHLHARGYSVYGVRLDGHGTAPRHLTKVTWRRWVDAVAHAHSVISHSCERTVLGGFSLGGVLAALHAADRPDEVAGLFTINAPLRLRHPLAPLVPAAMRLDAVLRMVDRARGAPNRPNVSESPDINYHVDYLWGVRELRAAIRVCRRRLPRITAPTLIVQSDRDPVIAPRSAAILRRRVRGPATVVSIPSDRHVIVRGEHGAAVFDAVAKFTETLTSASDGERARPFPLRGRTGDGGRPARPNPPGRPGATTRPKPPSPLTPSPSPAREGEREPGSEAKP